MSTGSTSRIIFASLIVVTLSGFLTGCGGTSQQPPPPAMPDFSISVSPVSASATLGNISSTVTVSVVPQNSFNGSVDIALQGLPAGVNASPASSFTLQSEASQDLMFLVSNSAAVGVFQLTVSGASGSNSHSAQVVLNTEPTVPSGCNAGAGQNAAQRKSQVFLVTFSVNEAEQRGIVSSQYRTVAQKGQEKIGKEDKAADL